MEPLSWFLFYLSIANLHYGKEKQGPHTGRTDCNCNDFGCSGLYSDTKTSVCNSISQTGRHSCQTNSHRPLSHTRTCYFHAATNTNGFSLNRIGLTYAIADGNGTPIPNGTFPIDPKITCSGGTSFQFGPLGNLKTESDSQLTVSAEGKSFTISITRATGMIQCTGN